MRALDLVDEIARLPSDWHGAGSVSANVLRAIASHADRMGAIQHSVETGSGKTTLLLSHLSADHVVFAVDAAQSMSQVRRSLLFNARSTTFVEGPSQRTLPGQTFSHPHQIVLIDGPHGYPFPDLEYYYLYPTIDVGGLLILDDIQIPSIGRMFDIIRADEMFELLEIVDDNTAFLSRTGAPLIGPESDSWWLQGYNRSYYQQLVSPSEPQLVSSPETQLVSPRETSELVSPRETPETPGAGRKLGSFLRGMARKLLNTSSR
jgi:hypothetical protein